MEEQTQRGPGRKVKQVAGTVSGVLNLTQNLAGKAVAVARSKVTGAADTFKAGDKAHSRETLDTHPDNVDVRMKGKAKANSGFASMIYDYARGSYVDSWRASAAQQSNLLSEHAAPFHREQWPEYSNDLSSREPLPEESLRSLYSIWPGTATVIATGRHVSRSASKAAVKAQRKTMDACFHCFAVGVEREVSHQPVGRLTQLLPGFYQQPRPWLGHWSGTKV
jgi:hypothetical protein